MCISFVNAPAVRCALGHALAANGECYTCRPLKTHLRPPSAFKAPQAATGTCTRCNRSAVPGRRCCDLCPDGHSNACNARSAE